MKHTKTRLDKLSKKLAIAFCAALFLLVSPCYGDVIEVPADQLQSAINNASAGDVIKVSSGTYTGDVTLKEGVAVIGKNREAVIIQGAVTGASNTRFENFTVNGSTSAGTVLYSGSSCQNIKIKWNLFIAETTGDYQGIVLTNANSAEIINNSIYLTSLGGALTGINFSGDNVTCANNSIYAEGSLGAEGLRYAGTTHTIKNNIVKTATHEQHPETAIAIVGDDQLEVDYNILVGEIGENVETCIGNLKGVDPSFVPGDKSLKVQKTSVALKAADPTYLYSSGVQDIGVYGGPDFDNDGDVDYLDLKVITDAWLTQSGDEKWDERADIYRDGIVNCKDYALLADAWDPDGTAGATQ